MKPDCFFCENKCKFNSYYKNIEIYTGCKKAKVLEKVCNLCAYSDNCQQSSKRLCAESRRKQIRTMHKKTDQEIIEYLDCIQDSYCPKEKIDLTELAIELAEDDWYEICHSSEDWDIFAKENNINKSEKEYIKEDLAPGLIPRAERIIKAKELKHPSLNLLNINEECDACVKCPEETRSGCLHDNLPDGWVGFPDLYLKETLKRGICGWYFQTK